MTIFLTDGQSSRVSVIDTIFCQNILRPDKIADALFKSFINENYRISIQNWQPYDWAPIDMSALVQVTAWRQILEPKQTNLVDAIWRH